MKNRNKIYQITLLAILSGIILLLSFTPLGYIKMPGLEITLLVVPVVIGAICLGISGGTFLGFLFGVTSFLQCVFGLSPFGATLLQINPFLTVILCIIPRTLMGFLTSIIFIGLNKIFKHDIWAHILACVSGALLNTILFMSMLCICFYHTEYIQSIATNLGSNNVFMFVILFVGINGLIEAIVNFAIGALVTKTLFMVIKKSQVKKLG